MKLFKFKNLAMMGAMSVGGLGLVGMGAHAVFTQNTTSQQTITAGTMGVTLHSDNATIVSGDGTATLTLAPASAAEGSSFVEAYHVVMTNHGNIPVTEVSYQLSDSKGTSPASASLESQLWACLYAGSGAQGGNEGEVYFNSPLSTVLTWGAGASKFLTLAPGTTDDYTLVVYAGSTDNGCGSEYDGYTNSPFSLGGITTPGQYDGQTIGTYNPMYSATSPWNPTFGTNPTAASLTNSSEGGVVTPILTVQYSG
jgi:predicted ribosomally synthesized peptide with SipW-like signal peptide